MASAACSLRARLERRDRFLQLDDRFLELQGVSFMGKLAKARVWPGPGKINPAFRDILMERCPELPLETCSGGLMTAFSESAVGGRRRPSTAACAASRVFLSSSKNQTRDLSE